MEQTASTSKKPVATLSDRLYYYESKDYLIDYKRFNDADFDDRNWRKTIFPYRKVISETQNNLHNTPPNEIILNAKSYIARIDVIIYSLQPMLSYIAEDYTDPEYSANVDLHKEDQELLLDEWKNELEFYKEQLQIIQKNAEFQLSLIGTVTERPQIQTQIQLPDNFTVKQLQTQFEPLLSINSAVLFLHYLREKNIIPHYNDSGLAELAKVFFARNDKNIRTALTDIYSVRKSKPELIQIKELLTSLIKEVDEDLKQSR